MVKITRDDLSHMQYIDSGGFGTIYKYDGKVYKIYRNQIKAKDTMYGISMVIDNPVLKFSIAQQAKLKRMMSLQKRITHTDLVQDIIYLDNKFAGVVYPFYDGQGIDEYKNEDLNKKILFAGELVRNAEELTSNNIYPLDYHLSNIMIVDGQIKIIDLDDQLTRITLRNNPNLLRKSVSGLSETVLSFLEADYDQNVLFDFDLRALVERRRVPAVDEYEKIYDYIETKKEPQDIFIFDKATPVEEYWETNRNHQVKNIFIYSTKEELEYLKRIIIDSNILVYDVVSIRKLDQYLKSLNKGKCFIKKLHLPNIK